MSAEPYQAFEKLVALHESLNKPRPKQSTPRVHPEEKPHLVRVLNQVAQKHPDKIDRFCDAAQQVAKKTGYTYIVQVAIEPLAGILDARPDVYELLKRACIRDRFRNVFELLPTLVKEFGTQELDYNHVLLQLAKHGTSGRAVSENLEPPAPPEEAGPAGRPMTYEELCASLPKWTITPKEKEPDLRSLMKRVKPEHRALVSDEVNALYLKHPEIAKRVAEKAPTHLKKGPVYFKRIVHAAETLVKVDKRIAMKFAEFGVGLLFIKDDAQYAQFLEGIEKVGRIGAYKCVWLLDRSPALLYLDGGAHYQSVIDGIQSLAAHDGCIKPLIQNSLELLMQDHGAHYSEVIEYAKRFSSIKKELGVKAVETSGGFMQPDEGKAYSNLMETILSLYQNNPEAGRGLLSHGAELYEREGKRGFEHVAECLARVPRKHKDMSKHLPGFAAQLSKQIGPYSMLVYPRLQDLALKVSSHNKKIGAQFLEAASKITEWKRIAYLPLVAESILPLADASEDLAEEMLSYSHIILRDWTTGYSKVAEAIAKLARVNEEYARQFLSNITYKEKREKLKGRTADLLLISSIRDQNDAQIVGKVIDKKKYGKEYAQQCGRFY